MNLAASIVAQFSQGRDEKEVKVLIRQKDGVERELMVTPLPQASVDPDWYV
jgi:hypothetical protein